MRTDVNTKQENKIKYLCTCAWACAHHADIFLNLHVHSRKQKWATADRLQVVIRSITHWHVLLRSPRLTTVYYVFYSHRDCRRHFLVSLKIVPGVPGHHDLSRWLSRSPALCHVYPVLSTVANKSDHRGRRGHSVNAAKKIGRDNKILKKK